MPKNTQSHISDEQIAAALSAFGIRPSGDQMMKIREYVAILLKWNKLTSLTSITDPLEVVARHFGESMFLSTLLPVEKCRLADVGSGAGFPGLALKILFPSLEVVLIESNKKKSAFLSEVARALNLSAIEVLPTRFEGIRPEDRLFGLVTARAIGGFPEILQWAKQALSRRGHLALWVGGEDATRICKTEDWIWSPAVHIPDSQRRFILIGRPATENK